MAKTKPKETSSIPAYTSMENMLKLVEALRRKNNDEKQAKPVFGMAGTAFTNTKSSLKMLGIIAEDCSFTEIGKELAFAPEMEKKKAIRDLLLGFHPYESLLAYIFQKGFVEETDLDTIVGYWGKFDFGSTDRNRREAATVFGSIVEYIGLGKFVTGRGGKATRIVWKPNAEEIIQMDTEPDAECEKDTGAEQQETIQGIEVSSEPVANEAMVKKVVVNELLDRKTPTIIVKVDMTTWGETQIKNFFKCAYGNFEDEH